MRAAVIADTSAEVIARHYEHLTEVDAPRCDDRPSDAAALAARAAIAFGGNSKETTTWPPNAVATLWRVATVGAWCPDSSREMADFVVPTR